MFYTNNTMKTLNSIIYNTVRLFILLLIIWTIESCSKDDTVNPDTGSGGDGGTINCDLSNVTFSGTVWPIINTNCTSCHSGTNANAGILLTNYSTIKTQASISPGNPGSLLGAITHASGNTAMPFGRAKLSDCNIDKITAWINAGMPDN